LFRSLPIFHLLYLYPTNTFRSSAIRIYLYSTDSLFIFCVCVIIAIKIYAVGLVTFQHIVSVFLFWEQRLIMYVRCFCPLSVTTDVFTSGDVTNSMKKSSSQKASTVLAGREMFRIVWNPKFHYRIMSQLNPLHVIVCLYIHKIFSLSSVFHFHPNCQIKCNLNCRDQFYALTCWYSIRLQITALFAWTTPNHEYDLWTTQFVSCRHIAVSVQLAYFPWKLTQLGPLKCEGLPCRTRGLRVPIKGCITSLYMCLSHKMRKIVQFAYCCVDFFVVCLFTVSGRAVDEMHRI
jgi:hypothetical protein